MNGETLAARLRGLALAAGAEELASDAAALEERIREQRFHVACIGQFKPGKSTLLNALVGLPVLPTGIIPVTSVPTILRYGRLGARVRTREDWTAVPAGQVEDYVTEQRNPGNAKGALAVEVLVPAPILEGGLSLVDTPGLGSVFEANTAATREFVPHVDAALVVLGADPPVSGEELHLIELIASEADTLLFVLNKIDRVTAPERDAATGFLKRVLHDRLGLTVERVYHVSAVGGGSGPDWEALVTRLRDLADTSRESLVGGALRRGVGRIGGALAGRIREQLAALTRPLAEYERRVEALAALGRLSEQALRELAPLLSAEEQRLEREFRARADGFLADALPAGLARLRTDWEQGRFHAASRPDVLEGANALARSLAYPWLHRMEAQAEAEYQRVVERFRRLAGEQLKRLAEATGLAEDANLSVPPAGDGLRARSHFAFSDRTSYHYARTPVSDLLEGLLPAGMRRRRLQRAAERYLADLLAVNASRVAGDLGERVRESRRELEAEIRTALRRVGEVAAGTLEWARVVKAKGTEETGLESARLAALLQEVERILEPTGDRAA